MAAEGTPAGSAVPAIIGIVAAALVVVGGAVAALLFLRKRQKGK